MTKTSPTPAEQQCRWPAEWEPHAATWLAWPHNRDTWPGRFEAIPQRFAELVRTLARFEPVHILAGNDGVMDQAEKMTGALADVRLVDIRTNDAWIRDHGPTFLIGPRDELVIVDWRFNAWGGKYPPWDLDNDVPRRIAAQIGVRRYCPNVVLEGGAIDGNGRGVVLTTESCLLDRRRNQNATRTIMEQVLRECVCATDVIWLSGGPLAGDDTDGHVDQLARFVPFDRVVVAVEEDTDDVNYQPLQANLSRLRGYRRPDGRPLDLVPLPMPRAQRIDGQRVPASYCNFYIANRCVLVPQFEDPSDAVALDILASLFPDREVVGLSARELIWGLGAFHCLTQQQPAAVGRRR